jgi:hypothetical protein
MVSVVSGLEKITFPELPRGRPSKILRKQWVALIVGVLRPAGYGLKDMMAHLNPDSPAFLHSIWREATHGVGPAPLLAVPELVEPVGDLRYQMALRQEQRRQQVDGVYLELAEVALKRLRAKGKDRASNDEAARLIKSAVIATEKRAKLWGLEAPSQLQVQSQNLNVSVEVTGTPEEVAGKIEKTHGLPAGAVQNIGRQLAQARSVALLEAETEAIDVGD